MFSFSFEKKNQEKLQRISDLTEYLKEVSQKNKTHLINLPKNYYNFVDVLVNEAKFSKNHLPPGDYEKSMSEMKIDFNVKNQVPNKCFIRFT